MSTNNDKDIIEKWFKKEFNPAPLSLIVGFMADATYSQEDNKKAMQYVAEVAYNNNYGNGVPPRPFFSNVVEENDYSELFEELYKKSGNIQFSLDGVGFQMKQDIQKEIINLRRPPNSPATILKKGSSNPLVDTGHMGDSVTYIIEDNRE